MATRILAHLGLLAADGRVAAVVGSEVVYLGGAGTTPATMTPYDVAAVRLADGIDLAGSPPSGVVRYLDALRRDRGSRAAALLVNGEVATASDLTALVEHCAGMKWSEAESSARAAGALVGAYSGSEA